MFTKLFTILATIKSFTSHNFVINTILSTLISNELGHFGPLGNPLPTACTSIFGFWILCLVCLLTQNLCLSRMAPDVYRVSIQRIWCSVLSHFYSTLWAAGYATITLKDLKFKICCNFFSFCLFIILNTTLTITSGNHLHSYYLHFMRRNRLFTQYPLIKELVLNINLS